MPGTPSVRSRRAALLLLALLPLAALFFGAPLPPVPDAFAQPQPSPAPLPPSTPTDAQAPSLALTWADDTTHAGVPITLTIQALDASGDPDAARAGTVSLMVDDDFARIRAGSTTLDATIVTRGRRVAVALSGGRAVVTVLFATPGQHTARALLDGSTLAGESDPLPV